MQGEKSRCSLEFYVILSVTIENICKQITPAAKFAILTLQGDVVLREKVTHFNI